MRWLPRRRTPPIRFEFQAQKRPAVAGWLLFAVACLFAGDVAWSYVDVNERTESAAQRLAQGPTAPHFQIEARAAYQPKDVEREVAFARAVITKISLPWNELFKALNETRVEEVQLLAIEPDAEARTVRITAEARDIPAMLTYVARLESLDYFKSVRLVQQELKKDARAGIVSFVVGAAWSKNERAKK